MAPGANATTGQLVVAAQGDTLQSIAARVYGSPDAWYRLPDANNLDFDSVLVAGQTVVAPAATASNNKLAFDLGKLVGSTAPNLPLPPPPPDKKNCITLIIVVVAVVVAAIVAPYALSAAASLVGGGATVATASTSGLMLAGAMTGAVTNVASQAVAVAAGVQDKFDWRGVAMAAVGGAVGAGLNAVTSNSILSAAATSVVSQGIEVITGMQRKFSWAAVATAAVNAGVTSGIDNSELGGGLTRNTGTDQFSQGFFHGALSGLAGSLVTDLLVPGKQDWAQIAIGAVGGGLAGGLAQLRAYGASGVAQLRAYDASRDDDSWVGNGPGSSLALMGSEGSQSEKFTARNFADDREARIAANPVASWLDKQSRAQQAAEILAAQAVESTDPSTGVATGSVVQLPQFGGQMGENIISSGSGYDYQTYGTQLDGTQRVTRHMHLSTDDYLGFAQNSVSSYFNQMDELASAAGVSTGAQIFAAATYGSTDRKSYHQRDH